MLIVYKKKNQKYFHRKNILYKQIYFFFILHFLFTSIWLAVVKGVFFSEHLQALLVASPLILEHLESVPLHLLGRHIFALEQTLGALGLNPREIRNKKLVGVIELVPAVGEADLVHHKIRVVVDVTALGPAVLHRRFLQLPQISEQIDGRVPELLLKLEHDHQPFLQGVILRVPLDELLDQFDQDLLVYFLFCCVENRLDRLENARLQEDQTEGEDVRLERVVLNFLFVFHDGVKEVRRHVQGLGVLYVVALDLVGHVGVSESVQKFEIVGRQQRHPDQRRTHVSVDHPVVLQEGHSVKYFPHQLVD